MHHYDHNLWLTAFNGVILITTKKKKLIKVKWEFYSKISLSTIVKYADFLNADQCIEMLLMKFWNSKSDR